MKKIFLLFFSFSMMAIAQDSEKHSFTAGTRGTYLLGNGKYTNGLNYYHNQYSSEVYKDNYTFKSNLNFRLFDPINSDERVFWDPTNISAEFLFDKMSFQIGFLQYRFSETFGLQILDVANPRDYSEFVFNDLSWAKRSVFGMNVQNKWDRLEALWMLSLWPNGDRLPYQGSAYDLTGGQYGYSGGVINRPWFDQYEYGARFKYLFENGLNLSFLGYHHFARPTVQMIQMTGLNRFEMKNSQDQVTSYGMGFSYVMGDFVIRGDFLLTLADYYRESNFNFNRRDHYQHLIGLDRIYTDWTVGFQIQNDFLYQRNFAALKVENTYFESWHPSVMAFVSDKNNDRWIQLKNSINYQEWKVDFVIDMIDGAAGTSSLFGNYARKDRALVDISRTF